MEYYDLNSINYDNNLESCLINRKTEKLKFDLNYNNNKKLLLDVFKIILINSIKNNYVDNINVLYFTLKSNTKSKLNNNINSVLYELDFFMSDNLNTDLFILNKFIQSNNISEISDQFNSFISSINIECIGFNLYKLTTVFRD